MIDRAPEGLFPRILASVKKLLSAWNEIKYEVDAIRAPRMAIITNANVGEREYFREP